MKILHTTTIGDDKTLASIETDAPARGRKWGIFKVIRLVTIPAGVEYASCRTRGVSVLGEIEYDARSARQSRSAKERAMAMFNSAI